MKYLLSSILLFFLIITAARAQEKPFLTSQKTVLIAYADSLRIASKMPELAYALLSADTVIYQQVIGEQRFGSGIPAALTDKFHLGSNSKAITGFMAALLVAENKIQWNTKFFDLYPALKSASRSDYYNITLQDLLAHRAGIKPCTKGIEILFFPRVKGTPAEQRLAFGKWLLTKRSVKEKDAAAYSPELYSNGGYNLAALMLEKATGISWEEQIAALGKRLNISIGIGPPNKADSLQPWGHNGTTAVAPHKKSWIGPALAPAGDLHMSLEDYTKWIQLNLKGLKGDSTYLSQKDFEFLHYGLPGYAMGWGWGKDKQGRHVSTHNGSDGTFFCHAYIIKERDLAVVAITNTATARAEDGIRALRKNLIKVSITED